MGKLSLDIDLTEATEVAEAANEAVVDEETGISADEGSTGANSAENGSNSEASGGKSGDHSLDTGGSDDTVANKKVKRTKKVTREVVSLPTIAVGMADFSDIHVEDAYVGSTRVRHKNGTLSVAEGCDDLMLEYLPLTALFVLEGVPRMRDVVVDPRLEASIAANGILEPLLVVDVGGAESYSFLVLDGARRLAVAHKLGIERVPCVFGHDWRTNNTGFIEAVCNMHREWGPVEFYNLLVLAHAGGLSNERLLNSVCTVDDGDFYKLSDIAADADMGEILEKLLAGKFRHTEIAVAYKRVESLRKQAAIDDVEGDEAEEGAEASAEGGEDAPLVPYDAHVDFDALSAEGISGEDLKSQVEKGDSIEGFGAHQQEVGNRECIDPAIRKAVMIRSAGRCVCCGRGGESYVDCLDCHHIVPVFLGGKDEVDNCAMLCITCHRMVHLYGNGSLVLDDALEKKYFDLTDEELKLYPSEGIFLAERDRMSRIVRLGTIIREGAAVQKKSREQLRDEHPVGNLGRRMPGVNGVQTEA